MVMFTNKTKVLLLLTLDVLDRARVSAGKAVVVLRLPVSLQIVLRALIEGAEAGGRPALLANIADRGKAPKMGGGRAEEFPVWDPRDKARVRE
jgi:hypothetical protein